MPDFTETGSLGIFHLKRIWKKSQLSRANPLAQALWQREWHLDVMVYDELGLGLEPALQAAYLTASFAAFEQWVVSVHGGPIAPSLVARLNHNIEVFFGVSARLALTPNAGVYPLSPSHWDFWHAQGYLVLPDVIAGSLCAEACAAIYEFLQMEPADPDSWYRSDPRRHQIMVQLFRHPALNKIRASPAVEHIYRQLWHSDNLWMSTDRVSFNPPERPGWQFPGPRLHWDADLKAPLGFNTQGLVYLTDTAENQGAFTCVPGFQRQIDDWLRQWPADKDPQQQDWQHWPTRPIAAPAGSLIVWHHALPHGSSPNKAASPRLVQYVNMRPVPTNNAANESGAASC